KSDPAQTTGRMGRIMGRRWGVILLLMARWHDCFLQGMKNSRVPRAQVGAESGPSLGTLEVGDVVTAEVKSTRDTWAELDVDGRPGRIYLADLSKTKISHPGDVVRPGETVRCFATRSDQWQAQFSQTATISCWI
ncbi:unnamed protein product, partial [Effrenium voratum]